MKPFDTWFDVLRPSVPLDPIADRTGSRAPSYVAPRRA